MDSLTSTEAINLEAVREVVEAAQSSSELHTVNLSIELQETIAEVEFEEPQTASEEPAQPESEAVYDLSFNSVLRSSGLNETSRFEDAPWFNFEGNIMVVGCGGIGSWTSMYLSRAFPKANIRIYDFDTVEIHNMAGQLFTFADIGRNKAEAVKLTTEILGGNNVISYSSSSSDISSLSIQESAIIIAAFDNNLARRELLERAKRHKKPFIDGRLRASMFEVFYVDTTNEEQVKIYLDTLVDDSLVDDGPCSFKQTSHVAGMIGSYITAVATTVASNIQKNQRRPVPFYSNFIVNGFMFNKMSAEQYKLWKQ